MDWLKNLVNNVLFLIGLAIFLLVGFGLLGWYFLAGLGILALAFFPLAWYWLAPTNRWFTFVKEGTAKIVVKGDAFKKVLIQWEGYTLDEHQNVVSKDKWIKDGEEVEEGTEGAKKYNEPWHPFGGFRYYGFHPIKDIYTYKFKWSGVTEDGKVVSHPPELLDYILLKDDVYWAKIEKSEDVNTLPLDIGIVLTIRVVNPLKALFEVQSWLETVINRTKPAVRDTVTQAEYATWIKKPEAMGDEIFKKLEERGLLGEFRSRYGIKIRKIQVKEINPPEEYRERTLAPYLAKLEKEAIVTRAEAEEERIKKVFSRIAEFGDLGRLVRTLEATEKSSLAASLSIQAVPGLQEALKGIFGKPPESVSSEELRHLRETIERMARKIEENK